MAAEKNPTEAVGPDGFPLPRRWNARWIWANRPAGEKNQYVLFRGSFRAPATDGVRLHITADMRYRLWLNGQYLGEGPSPASPLLYYYDTYDLTERTRRGRNILAVLVHWPGHLTLSRAGLLAEVESADGTTLAASGPDWRARRSDAWRENTLLLRMNQLYPYQEHFDARREDPWREPAYDDAAWPKAVVLQGRMTDRPPTVQPWVRLAPRDIPMPLEIPHRPERILKVEENLWLENRMRSDDLSIVLSTPGRPLQAAKVREADALCRGNAPCVLRCSTGHRRPGDAGKSVDGVYEPSLLLDFGRERTGHVEIDLEGPAGAIIDMGVAERLTDGHFVNAIECMFCMRYMLREGRQTFRTFAWHGYRYLKLRAKLAYQPLKIHAVRCVERAYPFEERGSFRSDDERLNRSWEISRETLKLCAVESLLDTPWREQAQWLGDVAAVTLGGVYACYGDARLPAKFLRQSAAVQQPTGLIGNTTSIYQPDPFNTIPDYSLWWIQGLWQHYLYSGETRWVDEFYPQALRIVDFFAAYLNADGLLENVPLWVFIDWAPVEKRGTSAALNALFYGTLATVEQLARRRSDAYTLEKARAIRAGLRKRFNTLWNERRGLFADARIDGRLSRAVSEHANAFAILYGLANAKQTRRIVGRIFDTGDPDVTEAQPFIALYVLRALDRAGCFDLALRYLRDRWGRRFVDRGLQTCLEEWYENGSWRSGDFAGFMRTHSHAWSAGPAEFLTRDLIGLEILEPGCRVVRLAPRAGLDYEVVYPTPPGPIRVSRKGGKVECRVPKGVRLK